MRVCFSSSSSSSSIICLIHFLSCTQVFNVAQYAIAAMAYKLWMIYGVDSHSNEPFVPKVLTQNTSSYRQAAIWACYVWVDFEHITHYILWLENEHHLSCCARRYSRECVCLFPFLSHTPYFSFDHARSPSSFLFPAVDCDHSHRKSLIPVLSRCDFFLNSQT